MSKTLETTLMIGLAVILLIASVASGIMLEKHIYHKAQLRKQKIQKLIEEEKYNFVILIPVEYFFD